MNTMDNVINTSAFYDSDEDVAWGPVSMRERRRDLESKKTLNQRQLNPNYRRQTAALPTENNSKMYTATSSHSSKYFTANESLESNIRTSHQLPEAASNLKDDFFALQQQISSNMIEATVFIEKFHGLTGILLKERKKSLYLLLEKYCALEKHEDVLKEIYEKLKPKTYLEETYKLELLIYFKRVWELFEILKNGNDIAASKIIKQKWFLTSILKDVSPKEFVRDIFPHMSHILRLKILKQILKQYEDETFINSLFDELTEAYGSRPALVLISGCSVGKIKNFLSESSLRLSLAQLKLLHDKDRSLIQFYYEGYYRRGGDMASLDSFSRYLARKDPCLFMDLRIQYGFHTYFGLGRQATKSFVNENKCALIEDPQKYLDLKVLKQSVLVRQLGKDFPKFLKDVYPETPGGLANTSLVFSLLDDYPKKKRYDLFSSIFKEVYGKDLYAFKEIMSENLLAIIPSHDEREKWVQIFDNDIKYIKYKRSTLAVPELKKQLLRADDVKFRGKLFEYSVTSCSISEDYQTLLEILILVCKRFRNSDDGTLYSVVSTINKEINLNKLSLEHWKYIHEIILLQDLRNMERNGDIIFEYCKYLHKSGSSFEELIPIFLKSHNKFITSFKFIDDDEGFEKLFLQLVLKYYPKLDLKYKSSSEAVRIVLAIKKWNKKHPKDVILASDEESIIQNVQEKLKHWVYDKGDEMAALKYLICVENDTDDFEDIYFENIDVLANYSITKWFLKYKPEVFAKYIDKLLYCFVGESQYLTRILKKFEYSGLVKSIEDFYLEKLRGHEQDQRDEIVQLLGSNISSTKYLELLEKYVPVTLNLEILKASYEEKALLQTEKALAKSVPFSKCHPEALPILINYCRGDCLQPALNSLYSCFNRIPEKNLKPYVSILLDKPVSLRKHAIFLTSLVFPVSVNDELRQEMLNKEKDSSVKKHLFRSSYKYFLKTPSDQLFTMLDNYMDSLTKHDAEDLNLISNIQCIPEKFKGKFAESVWKAFERLENEYKSSTKVYFNNFCLNIRDYDIKCLSSDFCIKIVNKQMFEGHERNPICSKFAIQFMMYCADVRDAIRGVMEILQKYKTEYWESKRGAHAKSVVYHICLEIFNEVMNTDHLRIPLAQSFPSILSEEWRKVFEQQETFEEYLMLEFMILKYGRDMDIRRFALKTSELFQGARTGYSDLVVSVFQDFLSNSLPKLLGDKKYNSKLMEFLIHFADDTNFSVVHSLLVIHLLPFCQERKSKENYTIMKKIRSLPEPIISITLSSHFKQTL